MSKRDARKALPLTLPREMRRALRARARLRDGLSATARRILRSVDFAMLAPCETSQPTGRPILLQLSKAEQNAVQELACQWQVSEADVLRMILHQALFVPTPFQDEPAT